MGNFPTLFRNVPSQAAIADAKRNKLADSYAAVREAAKERQVEAGESGKLGGRGNVKTPVELVPQGLKEKPAPKTRDIRAKRNKLADAYAAVKEAAKERRAEGQRTGGTTAGRGRPKADSLPEQIPESYSDPKGDETKYPEPANASARGIRARVRDGKWDKLPHFNRGLTRARVRERKLVQLGNFPSCFKATHARARENETTAEIPQLDKTPHRARAREGKLH